MNIRSECTALSLLEGHEGPKRYNYKNEYLDEYAEIVELLKEAGANE